MNRQWGGGTSLASATPEKVSVFLCTFDLAQQAKPDDQLHYLLDLIPLLISSAASQGPYLVWQFLFIICTKSITFGLITIEPHRKLHQRLVRFYLRERIKSTVLERTGPTLAYCHLVDQTQTTCIVSAPSLNVMLTCRKLVLDKTK